MAITAANIMSRQVIVVRPDGTLVEAARLFNERDISAAPVCAEDGTLLGMISESDLKRPFKKGRALGAPWWLNILRFGDQLVRELAYCIKSDHRCVRDVMTQPAITSEETCSISQIADLLLRHRIGHVPIMRAGRLVGIVSHRDLIQALACCDYAFDMADWRPSQAGSDHPAIKL
jgi:CBS domain-containing protein